MGSKPCNEDRADRARVPQRRRKLVSAERFQLLVDCPSERDQRLLYEMLAAKGYSCRVLVM